MKKNCWEFKGCNQNRNGSKNGTVKCPVPEMSQADGINEGKNAGRICWIIANTMCKGDTEGTFEEMIKICSGCDFYRLVEAEEGEELMLSLDEIQQHYENARTVIKANGEGNEK